MKNVLMFTLKSCPYCVQAHKWVEELRNENPRYQKIEITVIDEGEDMKTANQYDYYFVPTYYVAGKKQHEGAATKEKIKAVLDMALS